MDSGIMDSASHWNALANDAADAAAWDRHVGISPASGSNANENKAATYRAVAWALALEADTGRPHCSTCFGAHESWRHHLAIR